MTITLAEVIDVLQAAYPPQLAEPWDTGIGLCCGDPSQPVRRVLLAVDVDPLTVAQAIELPAQLLLTHHPLLFKPVQSISADTDKGALLHELIRADIAQFAAHTNADRAVGGVSDALAAALGLAEIVPMVPVDRALVGDGFVGAGLGRVGVLPRELPLRQFAELVSAALPATASGVRVAGDPERPVRRVAVCGGAGGGQLAAAGAAGADVYVTADLSHHVAAEHIADPARPALVEVAHWASEWPWLARVRQLLAEAFGGQLVLDISTRRTDAWSFRV